jgi:hypothetical protein
VKLKLDINLILLYSIYVPQKVVSEKEVKFRAFYQNDPTSFNYTEEAHNTPQPLVIAFVFTVIAFVFTVIAFVFIVIPFDLVFIRQQLWQPQQHA